MLVSVVIFDRISLVKEQFFYLLPEGLREQVKVGSVVSVPFGKQRKQGLVVALLPEAAGRMLLKEIQSSRTINLREISSVVSTVSLVPDYLIELALWLADYYHCSLFRVLRSVIPEEIMVGKQYRPLRRSYLYYQLTPAAHVAAAATLGRAPAQKHLLNWARSNLCSEVKEETAVLHQAVTSRQAITALVARGFLQRKEEQLNRQVLFEEAPANQAKQRIVFNAEQSKAYKAITVGPGSTYLLFGVTGSGKTEVYLQSAKQLTKDGGQAMLLVPEIALTPQLLQRCRHVLGEGIVVWHSRLAAGERFEVWQRVRAGKARVIIGSRSAIFLPAPNLRAIFIDEEHDWSYKQDQSPRYHTRTVAEKISSLTGCKLVLGSATPSLETFYRAQQGELSLLSLPKRVGEAVLPAVEIIDLKTAERAHGSFYLSERLVAALAERLAKGEQSILFLNRRGTSTALVCQDCGYTARCDQCDVVLTCHQNYLLCHYCGQRRQLLESCPNCRGKRLLGLGFGTQKVVADLQGIFPQARIARIDSDSLAQKTQPQSLFQQFQSGQVDVIVGTQVIAKGWDLPQVSLIGVILADVGLHLPDFRASERAFQLLTQVAGRAGRAHIPGEVIIQTMSIGNETIAQAAKQDYVAFYQQELAARRQHKYPPFNRLAKLTYVSANYREAVEQSEIMAARLREHVEHSGLEILGPAPELIQRKAGKYYFQILLKGEDFSNVLVLLNRNWRVDIDPA